MIKLMLAAGETVGMEAVSALGLDDADFSVVLARPAAAAALPVAWPARPIEAAGAFPSFGAIHDQLRAESPDACVLLDDGVFSRLFATAGDLLGIPTVRLVRTSDELRNLPTREKRKPDLFLLTDAGLLPAALTDERYGFTLIPLPAAPEELGDAFRAAVKAWAEGTLDAKRPDLSVVVPAFKEAENLPLVCSRLLSALGAADFSWEILLVDDFSPDATYKIALEQMRRSPRIRAFTKGTPRGMGNAIRHGLRMARAPVAAVTMGDGSDEVERIPDMYRAIRDGGYSLAIGSRYRRPENYANVPAIYRFWSRIFRLTARILTGVRLSDYTNAFRAFSMSIFSRYGPESGGFEISPEITFKAWLSSRKVTEVDVRHLKRASGQSKFSFLKAGPGYARILIKAIAGRLTGRWFTLDW
jgi:hypothetical protein